MKALLGVLLLAAACTPNFQSQDQVVDLRILAVRADPPEALFDLDAGTVQPVQLTILAVDGARRDAGATLNATVCAATDSGVCDQGALLSEPPLSRDAGDLFSTPLFVSSDAVVGAADASALGGLNGVRVQYSFTVDDGDPHGPQSGAKIVIYSPSSVQFLDAGRPNHNPILDGVVVVLPDGGSPLSAGRSLLADGEPLVAPAEVAIGLTPILPNDGGPPNGTPNGIEIYQTTDLRGNVITLPEFPAYSFYTTGNAEFDNGTASQPVDGGVAPPQGLTRFTAHADAGAGTMWIVVRDGRGGESWLTIPWTTP
jgi:hypothetical protein